MVTNLEVHKIIKHTYYGVVHSLRHHGIIGWGGSYIFDSISSLEMNYQSYLKKSTKFSIVDTKSKQINLT